ncbi:unnamed protein product [Leptidea sinapis]|uniref:Galectin n=1 Tax=Leptidea sinapis TaxID=189913 RepID=A0A5E4QX75_9NEOP|nr:unnamed protein product [Leptidea sinapis]
MIVTLKECFGAIVFVLIGFNGSIVEMARTTIREKGISFKLPTNLTHGTRIIIKGKMDVGKEIQVIVEDKAKTNNESCCLIFDAMIEALTVINSKNVIGTWPYSVYHGGNKMVPFEVGMEARASPQNESSLLDIYFDGNNQGALAVDACEFTTFENIKKITLKGVQQVTKLAFEFDFT